MTDHAHACTCQTHCLKCMDTGTVTIQDPRKDAAEVIACPGGCKKEGLTTRQIRRTLSVIEGLAEGAD